MIVFILLAFGIGLVFGVGLDYFYNRNTDIIYVYRDLPKGLILEELQYCNEEMIPKND